MKKTYIGSCHCQRVRFEADLDLDQGSGRCNCSICTKRRVWSAMCKPEDFRLLSGQDDLGDYQFATCSGHHRFCRHCGTGAFGDGYIEQIGGAYVAISIACLDDVTPEQWAAIPIRNMDGRHNNWFEEPTVSSYL